jgi:hypothetical protein
MAVMTFTAPIALWLLAAVPLVWLAHLVARTNFNHRQRRVQAALRSALLVALALALARPVVSTVSSRQSIVYVVDVSHSVSGAAIEGAAQKIDELNRAIRPAHSRVVAFGRTAAPIAGTAELRRLAQVGDPRFDRRGTDLEAALHVARAEIAPGHVPRIVLFSDGRPTAGDTNAAISQLAAERIPVFVEPLAVRSIGDIWIDAVDLPDRIVAGASFTATVSVGSQREGTAVIGGVRPSSHKARRAWRSTA